MLHTSEDDNIVSRHFGVCRVCICACLV